MGTFTHPITLIAPSGSETLEALVDTGAMFTTIPAPILERLGVKPFRTLRVRFANGQVEEWPMGQVEAELEGERAPILCLFGSPDAPPMLGAHALEAFLLTVDPVEGRLVPKEAYLMCSASEKGDEILCHFLYLIYRTYREVRNKDHRWSHEAFAKQASLCEKLGDKEMAQIYDMASPRKTPREMLMPFVARTGLELEDLPTVFQNGQWSPSYGGPKWANIAEHAVRLKQAIEGGDRSQSQRLSQEIHSLRHNTGSLSQKKGYRPTTRCCVRLSG